MDNIMGWMLLAAVTIGVGAVAVAKGEAIMTTLSSQLDGFNGGGTTTGGTDSMVDPDFSTIRLG